ncbi:MAG: hypothetical protein ACK4FZ_04790 [Vogesella sp.]|uniref:hypothetical protein n=1 Tax=Vogesella sp. TaxID=1904252 RepID=UPI0039187923
MTPIDLERTGRLLAEEQRLLAEAVSPPASLTLAALLWPLLLQLAALAWLYAQRHSVAEPVLWLALLALPLPLALSLRLWRWQRYARQQTQLAVCRRQLAERYTGATPC